MVRQLVNRPRPGLSCEQTKKIFHLSRGCVIAIVMTLGTFGPTTALGGDSATRSFATAVVFSHATRTARPPISSPQADPPEARPDPSGEGHVVDQLYEKLMGECARVLNRQE
jgi:hypothetical protein